MKPWYIDHAETLTQTVLGLIISFIVLYLFGMSFSESLALQSVFFVVSYIRSYLVRRFFAYLELKRSEGKGSL